MTIAFRAQDPSYYEATARQRVQYLLDAQSWQEFCPPQERLSSPHLGKLGAPPAFDDGVVVGQGRIAGQRVLLAAQEGKFNGGAVGEVHGAKIVGLLRRALRDRPQGVLLLVDSGGVRLHEANAGLIAISEIMRAVLAVQGAGIPVWALVGGSCGAFGGMGIVTRLCSGVIMSEQGRLGLSGPEVIETVKGVEEFDSRDRPLVWRITGGKIRRSQGEARLLVEDRISAFRQGLLTLMAASTNRENEPTGSDQGLSLVDLQQAQAELTARRQNYAQYRDGQEVWAAMGFVQPQQLPLLAVEEFNRQLGERGAAGGAEDACRTSPPTLSTPLPVGEQA